tara:strand:+ start:9531 stop:10016 length:486 start_codon:yes stop_codon:yes gene_type:complete
MKDKITKEPKIICAKCEWSWDIKDGGDDLYNCHKCGHVNTQKNITENKTIIKRILKEEIKLQVTDETPDTITILVEYNGRNAGIIMVAEANAENTLEIVGVKFKKEYETLFIVNEAVKSLWGMFKETNDLIVAPKPEGISFWNKLGFNRISPTYLILQRGH